MPGRYKKVEQVQMIAIASEIKRLFVEIFPHSFKFEPRFNHLKGILIFIIAVFGIVFSVLTVWFYRRLAIHKSLLGGFVGLIMILLLFITVIANYGENNTPVINIISLLFYILLLMIPPTMYLYVVHYLSEKSISQVIATHLPHYFPAIGLMLINMTAFFLLTNHAEESIYYTVAENVMFYANSIALLFIFLLQNALYLYLATMKRKAHKNRLPELFTFEKAAPFQWIRDFILGYALLIIGLYLQMIQVFGNQNWSFALIVFVYVVYIFYKGLQNPSFSEIILIAKNDQAILPEMTESDSSTILEIEGNAASIIAENEEKSTISDELQKQIWQKVQELMENEKVYLDQELTVYKLAKIASTNSKYLRIAIQKEYGKNFAHYINSFRILHAKKLLADPEQAVYSIEYIGEASGFKSKSSFYTAFKQQTGLTPQAYKKSN